MDWVDGSERGDMKEGTGVTEGRALYSSLEEFSVVCLQSVFSNFLFIYNN